MLYSRFIMVGVGVFILASCTEEAEPDQTVVTLHKSSAERQLNPSITNEQFVNFNKDNNQFAWDLYRELAKPLVRVNTLFSPYSISTALAMTYAGASDKTKASMEKALNFNLEDKALHAGFNKLSIIMDSRQLPEDGTTLPLTLNTTNTLWPGSTWVEGMSPTFLDTLSQNYGTGVYVLDYQIDPEACRLEINDAVYDWTNNLIEDLIPEGELTTDTAFVITNTIYMNAPWAKLFNEWATSEGDFNNYNGSSSNIDMMQYGLEFSMRYAFDDQAQALAIPYRGNSLEMVVFLPDEGKFDAFEQSLSQERIAGLIDNLDYPLGNVSLRLPKFSLESTTPLMKIMEDLGMILADFPLIGSDIEITGINHKAFIDVTEHGTEASAATSVSGSSSGAPSVSVEFIVDRPFIFIIHDRPTGNILFVGTVLSL